MWTHLLVHGGTMALCSIPGLQWQIKPASAFVTWCCFSRNLGDTIWGPSSNFLGERMGKKRVWPVHLYLCFGPCISIDDDWTLWKLWILFQDSVSPCWSRPQHYVGVQRQQLSIHADTTRCSFQSKTHGAGFKKFSVSSLSTNLPRTTVEVELPSCISFLLHLWQVTSNLATYTEQI